MNNELLTEADDQAIIRYGRIEAAPRPEGRSGLVTIESAKQAASLPCASCPWRHGAQADDIPGYDPVRARVDLAACAEDRGLSTPIMACHKSEEGADRVCVGYAVSEDGYHNIALRLMAVTGRIDLAAMYDAVERSGAPLWPTYADMIEALTRSETVPLTEDQLDALEATGVRD